MPSDDTEKALIAAGENTLNELFSLDPLQLTDQQFERVITELRAQRLRYIAQEAIAAAKPPRGSVEKAAKETKPKLTLAQLGLGKTS